jgi:hypothetical protein
MAKNLFLILFIGIQLNSFCQNRQLKYVNESNSFRMEYKQVGQCNQFIPIGWTTQTNPEGTTFDLTSPDKSMYVGYAIFPINPYLHTVYPNNNLYSTNPALVILKLASLIGQTLQGFEEPTQFDNSTNLTIGDYVFKTFQSDNLKGSVLYRVFPGDGINTSNILAIRFAIAKNNKWSTYNDLLSRIATSIRCDAKLVEHNFPIIKARISNRSSSANKKEDYNYNAQLGTEEAHNAATGENFTFTQDAWNETGPQGAGYYVKIGNDNVKLSPGRSRP